MPAARDERSAEIDLSIGTEPEDRNDEEDENLIPFAHELSETLKLLIARAADKSYGKEELCFGLQQQLREYAQLRNTSYQREINAMIMVECKNQCAMHLRAGELDKLWLS